MARQSITASIDVHANPEILWDIANEVRLMPQLIDWVYDAWREDEGPMGEGSVYVERAKPGPKEGIYRWVVTAFEPQRRAVHSHEGRELEADLEILIEPIDDRRTRYTQTMRFRALPAFRPLGFVLERTVMKRKMRRDFNEMVLPNVRRIAEERAHERGPATPGAGA